MNTKLLITGLALAAGAGLVRADTTVSPVHRHAYGANVGWIDARADGTNGAVLAQHYCTGHLWSANVGWIGLGGGPTNGWHYSNASATDWGVNHDGAGHLTGHAYGANVGWLTFEQTYGKPGVDLMTGNLTGYIWGANVGWISLTNSQAFVRTDALGTGPDSDGDGLPDAWELEKAGDLVTLDPLDPDSDDDGVPDEDEYVADTDPLDPASRLVITAFDRAADTDAVTWPVAQTRLYRLLHTDSLTNAPLLWSDSGAGLIPPSGAPAITQSVADPTDPQRFYRVQAVVPLSP
jgi:hypothetical protein